MSETTLLRNIARVARDRLRDGHRQAVFRRAMRMFLRDPNTAADDSGVLTALVYGWGNESWSGAPELLHSCIKQALITEESVLECGSGLTTIVLGAVAQRTGIKVWSLEHMPEWAERVSMHLNLFAIESVRLCLAPLVSYGEYDWYTPPSETRSKRFGLVVCDGPPSSTRGGRYGLVPVMKRNLAKGCVILLDDAQRESEQVVIRRWACELPCSYSRAGAEKPYFRVVIE